jgi:hypothetical protein
MPGGVIPTYRASSFLGAILTAMPGRNYTTAFKFF